ncbi:MAG: helix-turn-helix transcriptional regulator [Nitrosarchaeum sp.]|nr:helix-turn-helix transcriptional regulator [Nitrosarchaeum sp.]
MRRVKRAKSHLAKTVQRLRLLRGLDQGQLARAIGVSRCTISRIETDKTKPSTKTLLKLIQYFGVTWDNLMGGNLW